VRISIKRMSRPKNRAESLQSAERQVIELIANGVNLPDVLEYLCQVIEAHSSGVISTVLLTDTEGKQLWPVAGRRFPAALIPVISPWPIGADRGACGTAAFLKERVIISDVTKDPRWPEDCRVLAVNHGLRAAWSQPVISREGTVLGTLAMYYPEARVPDAGDLELITAAAHIANIAIRLEKGREALGESEKRFRLAADTAPVMIWMAGPDGKGSYFNRGWQDFTGRSEADLMSGLAPFVHPEDYDNCLKVYKDAFSERRPFRKECRLRRYDGEYRWVADVGVPRYDEDGRFIGYIGTTVDFSDHKQVEESLSNFNGRLIAAQEEERRWIARELHDDISQRLVTLTLNLSAVKAQAAKAEVQDGLARAIHDLADLGQELRAVSQRLHSANLEYLGLVTAAAAYCRERSKQHDVEVQFLSEGIPGNVPQDLSLCLFRVLQESLQNGIKHSGSRRFQVTLHGGPDNIDLRVCDFGIGFKPADAIKGNGLGLISMKERLKLVNGTFVLDSQPGRGTQIHARVPYKT
jgi:PAS domain S-box-containing protein